MSISGVSGGNVYGTWGTAVPRTNYRNMETIPPVDEVKPVSAVQPDVETPAIYGSYHQLPTVLEGADPSEISVRARMGKGESGFADFEAAITSVTEDAQSETGVGNMDWMSALEGHGDFAKLFDPAEMAVRSRIDYVSDGEFAQIMTDLGKTRGELAQAKVTESSGEDSSVEGMEGTDHVHSSECQTCQNRTYVDDSDDGSVSYQSPTHISPEESAVKVRAHEQEHVVNEQAYAERDNKEVVSQSVQIFKDVCPECGTSYTSGGLTTTVTQQEKEADGSVVSEDSNAMVSEPADEEVA